MIVKMRRLLCVVIFLTCVSAFSWQGTLSLRTYMNVHESCYLDSVILVRTVHNAPAGSSVCLNEVPVAYGFAYSCFSHAFFRMHVHE